jgi:Excalibur calcium-binding domain
MPGVSYDLDCPDIAHRVYVVGVDIHRFDGDGDGIGCESY